MTVSCILEEGITRCSDPLLYSKLGFIAVFAVGLIILYHLSDRWFR